jgi:hypothetical protein
MNCLTINRAPLHSVTPYIIDGQSILRDSNLQGLLAILARPKNR